MKLRFLASLVAFASITWMPVAQAQMQIPTPTNNWVVTGRSPQGDTVLVDTSTISKSAHHAGFWFQVNHANQTASRLYAIANCVNPSLQPVWSVIANQQGMITQNESVLSERAVTLPAGSLGETAYKYACFNNYTRLDALESARRTNAEAIIRAMEITANMFR